MNEYREERKPGRKKRILLKILIWFTIMILVMGSGVFTIGYYYYGRIIQIFLTEAIQKGSKGLYKADIGHLRLDIFTGDLFITGFSLVPDTCRYDSLYIQDTVAPILVRLHIDEFSARDFNILDFIRHRNILIRSIRFDAPDVELFLMRADPSKSRITRSRDIMFSLPLPEGVRSAWIKEISLNEGKLIFHDLSGDTTKTFAIPQCNILISNVWIDSTYQGTNRLFNADDIRFRMHDLHFKTSDELYDVLLGEVELSSGEKKIMIRNFKMDPMFSRSEFSRKRGFQTDQFTIAVDTITLYRLDFRSLLLEEGITAGTLAITGMNIDNYRDKRIPLRKGYNPPMPHELVRGYKRYLNINSVVLQRGTVTYSERVDEGTGTIRFDEISATMTGLTNDSVLLRNRFISVLKGSARLQGKGRLNATFQFWFGDKKNRFTFSAYMGSMDLTEVNPMLTKLTPVTIVRGKANKLVIPEVSANNNVARGKLLFYYNDLIATMESKEKDAWSKIKTGIINVTANELILKDQNPSASGKLRSGIVHFKRDKSKGIVNFIWKSVLSGIKSSIGISTKEQKTIKKAEKKAAK